MLCENSPYAGRNLSSFQSNTTLPRHRWYGFKEGFASALVLEAIAATGSKRKLKILDPFSGSGTTLLTAAAGGHRSVAIEVNPFLAFAGRAKCTHGPAQERILRKRIEDVIAGCRHEIESPLEGQSTFTERPEATRWLFNRSVLRGFTALDRQLARLRSFREPFRLALLRAAMDCCNARRDGKCLRYRKDWKVEGLSSANLKESFRKHAFEVIEDLVTSPVTGETTIFEADCRTALDRLPAREYDLVVTSPPYLNSSDYSDVYRPELFLGGFVSSNAELRKIRLRTIRSHVQVNWEPVKTNASRLLDPIIEQLKTKDLWDERIPAMVISYFHDLARVLIGVRKTLKKGGLAWLVVSTSAYGGVQIPVDLILADIATNSGWKLVNIHVLRQLRAAGQQWPNLTNTQDLPLRESLLMLRA